MRKCKFFITPMTHCSLCTITFAYKPWERDDDPAMLTTPARWETTPEYFPKT